MRKMEMAGGGAQAKGILTEPVDAVRQLRRKAYILILCGAAVKNQIMQKFRRRLP
jgi:hypothetical protein